MILTREKAVKTTDNVRTSEDSKGDKYPRILYKYYVSTTPSPSIENSCRYFLTQIVRSLLSTSLLSKN